MVTSIVAMDQHLVRFVSVPGTREPGRGPWAWKAAIPLRERSTLLAAFNSGFKFRHIAGGYYTEGRVVEPLVDGEATLVVHRDGSVSVGAWGRDEHPGPDVVSARQNLRLIVDGGAADPELMTRHDGSWGRSRHQLQSTWRSGVGIDADGRFLYAAGAEMDLQDLADALVDAGAVRAMELDIHSGQVTYAVFQPHGDAFDVDAQHLVDAMPRSAARYLEPDQRDFFAAFVR